MGRTKYVSVDIRFEFLQWALWRTLIKTKYFLLVHHTTSHLANLNTWWFKHSGDISCFYSLNQGHTDESWEGQNMCLWIYALNLFINHSGKNCWEHNIFCSFITPQALWQSSARGGSSTLVASFVFHLLTWAMLMNPGKDATCVCGYTCEFVHWALWRTLMRIEDFLFVHHSTTILD